MAGLALHEERHRQGDQLLLATFVSSTTAASACRTTPPNGVARHRHRKKELDRRRLRRRRSSHSRHLYVDRNLQMNDVDPQVWLADVLAARLRAVRTIQSTQTVTQRRPNSKYYLIGYRFPVVRPYFAGIARHASFCTTDTASQIRSRTMSNDDETPTKKNALSITEFCRLYGIKRSSAYKQMTAGRLKFRKCGRRRLIGTDDAKDWWNQL